MRELGDGHATGGPMLVEIALGELVAGVELVEVALGGSVGVVELGLVEVAGDVGLVREFARWLCCRRPDTGQAPRRPCYRGRCWVELALDGS